MRGFSMVVVAIASAGFLASVAHASEERKIPDGVTVLTEEELRQNFVRSDIAGMDGCAVGIVGNQPAHLAGVLDINASNKAARFVRFCDCFNIPFLLSLHRYPLIPASMAGLE